MIGVVLAVNQTWNRIAYQQQSPSKSAVRDFGNGVRAVRSFGTVPAPAAGLYQPEGDMPTAGDALPPRQHLTGRGRGCY